jgi:hypothetical protein
MFYFCSQDPHFWIQTKGMNAGQPLKQPIANCVGIRAHEDVLVPQYLYYVVLHLYNQQRFASALKGSVIPYITQRDISRIIARHFIGQLVLQ